MEEDSIPLPPDEYMDLVCGSPPDVRSAFVKVGQKMAQNFRDRGFLFEGCRLLDVGCGCGRLARYLVNEPLRSYTGFDRHRGMIEWCQQEIEQRVPHFKFNYFDLKSSYQSVDNQSGAVAVESFQFPYDDSCFDVAILTSVFTHMPLDESRHYLRELSRVLAQGGRVWLSVFLTESSPYLEHINYFYSPEEWRDAVIASGLQLTTDDSTRLLTRANLKFDQVGHNWFLLTKQ